MKLKDLIPYLKTELLEIKSEDNSFSKADCIVRDAHERAKLLDQEGMLDKEIVSIETFTTKIILKI